MATEDADPATHFMLMAERAFAARDQAISALKKLVRQGDDGIWRTTQNGDADVTAIVAAVLSAHGTVTQDKHADG